MNRNQIIKMIWVKAKELGLYNSSSPKNEIKSSQLYEIIYSKTQKNSMRDCTDDELEKVLKTLNLFSRQNKTAIGKATQKQLNYIKFLAKELNWNNPKKLDGFIKKYTGIDRMEWLSPKQASNIIEGLKKMLSKRIKFIK